MVPTLGFLLLFAAAVLTVLNAIYKDTVPLWVAVLLIIFTLLAR